jgi:hypothetical protein
LKVPGAQLAPPLSQTMFRGCAISHPLPTGLSQVKQLAIFVTKVLGANANVNFIAQKLLEPMRTSISIPTDCGSKLSQLTIFLKRSIREF